MIKRIKVLFLASWYPSEEDPINGIFIRRHAESVSEACDISVISYHPTESKKDGLEISYYKDIQEIRIYQKKANNRYLFALLQFKKILFFLMYFYKGFKIIVNTKGKPDIIHLNVIYPMGIAALFIYAIYKIPFIVTEHTSPFSIYTNNIFKRLYTRLILQKAQYILPVSNSLKREMELFYRDNNYLVIPNIIDLPFLTKKNNKNIFSDKKNILHVSRLIDHQKNISGIILAISQIIKKRDDFRLEIIGDGPDREKLEKLARRYGLSDKNIVFSGKKTNQQLLESFHKSCFFILNSYHETFSIVCAEALACGLPVIATRCGGPEEYINDKMGLLIEVDNKNQLIAAIEYMLDHYSDYDKDYLQESILKKFNSKNIREQIKSVYTAVLKKDSTEP
ncbi:MAG TPA: glycosyltransferase [Methanoregulaceae archaeon]|nr:glycosyltransferase [Methanoregulaceae archaeon]HRU80695.1 glycosyltransferase [Methanolinea sp.]